MATSLLRLGRLGSLKCLMRESWGTQRTPLVAALCTKADGPPKPAKKAKGASKTIEAGERASLLAYKPTVAFPSKVSATGFLPKDISLTESSAKTVTADAVLAAGATTVQPPSVTESASSEKLTKTTESAVFSANVDETTTDSPVADTAAEVIKEEAEITEDQHADKVNKASEGSKASEAETEVKHDQEDSSSSSSSDSESDSDSDDEKSEKKPKSEPVDESGGKAADEKKDSVYTQKQVDIAEKKVHSESFISPSASFGGSPEDAEAVKQAKPKELHTQSTEAVSPSETLIDPAPILSSSTTKAIPEVTSESITVVSLEKMVDVAPEVKMTPAEDITENVPETKAKAAPEQAQETANVKASETLIDPAPILSSSTTKAIPEVTSESITVVSPEEMVDVAPEVKTTPAEDITENVPETKAAPEQAQETANVKANPKVESSFAKAIDAVSEAVQEIVVKPECEAETVAKADGATGIETTPSEDLKDAAPVAADAVESLAETPQEQAPAKAPEPEPEPFDNTTYKNLQHHQYNMYTFADMDVEMSKHRLPQPSSGRPSPSH